MHGSQERHAEGTVIDEYLEGRPVGEYADIADLLPARKRLFLTPDQHRLMLHDDVLTQNIE